MSRPLAHLETAALVAIGGFAGATLRHFVATLSPGLGGTLVANTAGSFALGFLVYEAIYAGGITEQTRLVVATGFLSSFTTYSTFALQSVLATPLLLVGNVVATYALGFAGVLAGRALARRTEVSD